MENINEYFVSIEHNGKAYKSSVCLSKEDIDDLYQTLEKLDRLNYLSLPNTAGGKDFFPKNVLQNSIIRVLKSSPRSLHKPEEQE